MTVERNHDFGVFHGHASLDLEDVVVRDNRRQAAAGVPSGGIGIGARDSGALAVRRAFVASNTMFGVTCRDGAQLALRTSPCPTRSR